MLFLSHPQLNLDGNFELREAFGAKQTNLTDVKVVIAASALVIYAMPLIAFMIAIAIYGF
jgi:hypothetical protein